MANLTTWQATIQDDDTGAAVVSPVVTVRLGGPSGDLADLFDINGGPIANPVTGGTDGFVQFQFRPSRYWIQAADGGTFSSAWYVDADGDLNWETRADLVSDIAAGMILPDGTVVSDGVVQYVASTGATAISDMPGWLPFGDVYVDHFGENTTPGTTSMAAAILAAASYSPSVHFKGVDYLVDGAGAILMSIPDGIEFFGVNGSRIVGAGSAAYFETMRTAGRFLSDGVDYLLSPQAGAQAFVIRPAGSDVKIANSKIDGATTYTAGFNWTSYGIGFVGTGAQNDIVLENCELTRLVWPILKANTDTSTQDRITVRGCSFHGNFREDCGFNSPNGSMANVTVEGCKFWDSQGVANGLDAIHISFASIDTFTVKGNTFAGSIRENIHIEEACKNFSITGNSAKCDYAENGSFCALLGNNVSGVDEAPENGVVSSNAAEHTGVTKTNRFGVYLYSNAFVPAKQKAIQISSNTMAGFGRGYLRDHEGMAGVEFTGNVAMGCDTGFKADTGLDGGSGNTSLDCTFGVESDKGAVWVSHKFEGCTTNALAVANNIPLILRDPTFVLRNQTHTGGDNIDVVMFDLGANDRAYGIAAIATNADTAPHYSNRIAEITWDGTTLTNTDKTLVNSGSMVASFQNVTSQLIARSFSSAARTGINVSARFHGEIVVAF